MSKKAFTYGDQFSPSKIKWPKLLSFITSASGDRETLNSLIGNEYFQNSGRNQRTMAMNTVLSLNSYGLIEIDKEETSKFKTTSLFDEIYSLSSEEEQYQAFAKHILVNLDGLALIRCIDSMKNREDNISLENINYELQDLGFKISPSCTYVSTMKAWLNLPNTIIGKNYSIDWNEFTKLLGITKDFIDTIYEISIEQKYFLMSLLALNVVDYKKASMVANHTRNIYKVRLTTKMLVKNIVEPLEELGLIETQKTTKGRGAKSHEVKLTNVSIESLQIPMLKKIASQSGFAQRLLNKPFEDVLNDLDSEDKHVKGQALELLSIWLIRMLDLTFTGWRKRDKDTGGAEVDVMAANDKIIYNRWQIQCKNTKSVIGVDVIAKEVGLTVLTKADVIMVVTTSSFSKDAIRYTNEVLSSTRYYVILIDGKDLKKIKKERAAIVDILNDKAREVFNRKEDFEVI